MRRNRREADEAKRSRGRRLCRETRPGIADVSAFRSQSVGQLTRLDTRPRRRMHSRTPSPSSRAWRSDRVDVCAAHNDRDVGAILLDSPRDLHRARVFDRHACDPDEIGPILTHAVDDVVERQIVQLPVEQLDLVASSSQRAGDIRDAQRRNRAQCLSNSLRSGGVRARFSIVCSVELGDSRAIVLWS